MNKMQGYTDDTTADMTESNQAVVERKQNQGQFPRCSRHAPPLEEFYAVCRDVGHYGSLNAQFCFLLVMRL